MVQVEKFEQPDVATLAGQWEALMAQGDMSFTADVPPGSAGNQSLLMDRQTGSGGSLYRRLKNATGGYGHDRIFARYYATKEGRVRVWFDDVVVATDYIGPMAGKK